MESGILGRIESFDFREGTIFDWPATTNSFWRREAAGGGVFADLGAHVLDLLLWWLGDFTSVTYADDSQGGVEADCRLELTMKSGEKASSSSPHPQPTELRHHSRQQRLGGHSPVRLPELCMVHPTSSRFGTAYLVRRIFHLR